jgi:oxalate decarboxylase/phosphoglucose isomerase-like protein (cupin superfamily)
MTQTQTAAQTQHEERLRALSPHDRWIETLGVPVHRGYYIEDVRTVEVGPWPERGCNVAFLQLSGQEGVTEARVTEIPPGKTLPPLKFSLDEIVYVVEGRGLTTVSAGEGQPQKTFEWQKHSLFLLPHSHKFQLTNTQGDKPARLLHQNYLPLAMLTLADPDIFFNNPYEDPGRLAGGEGDFYSEAKAQRIEMDPNRSTGYREVWVGNFFPDMRAWDKLVPFWGRGAGGQVVGIRFPGSENWAHMSVFPARSYKKGHRHGPGVVIVIPSGEGYSVMWPEGAEKMVIPWHEGSVFVPPNRWFHQHFNTGSTSGRYLALHSPRLINVGSEAVDPARDQIEYPDEDPWIRQMFEEEMAARGMTSEMPEEAYQDRDFEWSYDQQP